MKPVVAILLLLTLGASSGPAQTPGSGLGLLGPDMPAAPAPVAVEEKGMPQPVEPEGDLPVPPQPGVEEVPLPPNSPTGLPPSALQGQPKHPDSPSEDEPVIPIAYDASRYESAWENNPFTRKVAAMAQPVVNWAQDWVLLSMYNNRGKVRVSIRNRQTSEVKRIGDGSAEKEFTLVKANFHRSRSEASAEISRGGETAIIKYDETMAPLTINNVSANTPAAANGQVRPGAMPAGQMPPGGVRPGAAPNPAMGMPQRPAGVPPQVQAAAQMQAMPFNAAAPNMLPQAAPGAATPPPISRRRQLIPAPIINPPPSAPTPP